MILKIHSAVNDTKHTTNDRLAEGVLAGNGEDRRGGNGLIVSVYPNDNGTITELIDASNHGFLCNPMTDTKLQISKFSASISRVFWDEKNRSIFYGHDDGQNVLHCFVYDPQTLRGPTVEYIDATSLAKGFEPILVSKGIAIGYDPVRGAVDSMEYHIVNSFEALYEEAVRGGNSKRKTVPELLLLNTSQFSQSRRCFHQLMALHFLRSAYLVSQRLQQRELWRALSVRCLELLAIDLGISVFRSLQNASSVLLLDGLKNEDDFYLVSGHCSTLLADFEMAQKLFLLSREPLWALKMRRDLLQFDRALELSHRLAPDQLPAICLEYAQQMEFQQKYKESLALYQRAQRQHEQLGVRVGPPSMSMSMATESAAADAVQQCLCGVVRCTLRIGYIQKGVALALEAESSSLQHECGNLLQSMKQYDEAGQLFVRCAQTTKAVNCFILSKNWEAVQPLLSKLSTPSLHIRYAKEMEMAAKYEDALRSYQVANDKLSVIRLYLYHLDAVEEAISVVRTDPFVEGAKLIAAFTANKRDIATAIEFLVLSRNFTKALEFATSYNEMEIYCDFLDRNNESAQFQNVAANYVAANDHQKAARCFLKAQMFEEALLHFLEDGCARNLDDILSVIRQSQRSDDGEGGGKLIDIVLDHIECAAAADANGEEIEQSTLFRLYLAIGDIDAAAKMATAISAQSQRMGKYKEAHQVLFEMVRELMARNIATKKYKELTAALFLLHSYILVRVAIQRGDGELAAKLLIRVCDSISKFPSHTVQLLTSAVIQCQKSGLYAQALEYALNLMRPQLRTQIIPKYKNKIEAIVRHSYQQNRTRSERADCGQSGQTTPCPHCKMHLLDMEMHCESCKHHIPYCVVTGKHMVREDWTHCPQCSFPALYSSFRRHIEKGLDCPMCRQSITAEQLSLCEEPPL